MATDDFTCSHAGCDRLRTSRGLCKTHRRHELAGKPLAPLRSYAPSECSFGGCSRPKRSAAGLCGSHARQVRQGKAPTAIRPRFAASGLTCVIEGCEAERRALGLCVNHHAQVRRGSIEQPSLAPITPRRKPSPSRKVTLGCSFEDCVNPHDSHGLCSTHGKQRAAGKTLTAAARINPATWSPWRVQSSGYVARWRSVNGVREYELQHRHVMEEHLGRSLLANENVHHLNGDRADNRLGNLELWNTAQPAGQRLEDKLRWAHELIALYGAYPLAPANE